MATFCLTSDKVQLFKQGLRSGEINPGKLDGMTSQQRREFLAKYVGENNARQVNALFESKLLLKNKKAGMISWAKKVTGITPELRRDLLAKIEKSFEILNPENRAQFLSDLVSHKFKLDLTVDEAKIISEVGSQMKQYKNIKTLDQFLREAKSNNLNLSENTKRILNDIQYKLEKNKYVKAIDVFKKRLDKVSPDLRSSLLSKIDRMSQEGGLLNPLTEDLFLNEIVNKRLGLEITYEEAKTIRDLSETISNLESKTDKTKPDIKLGRAKIALTEYAESLNPKRVGILENILNLPRTALTSLDLSAPLNQGWGFVSRKRFYTSLKAMFKGGLNEEGFKNLQAEIITHPEYKKAVKARLRISELGAKLSLREENIMSTLLDKIPGISHSQRAYTAFLNKLRFDAFIDFVTKAEVAGEDTSIGSSTNEQLAAVANDFTGGASLGKYESATPLLSGALFSPRKIASTVNMLNPLNYVRPSLSKTARLERTRNIIGSTALTFAIISLYALITGKKQETDPRSTEFGKIKSGDTRLDLTGGNGTYTALISRLLTRKIKGSDGILTDLGTGYKDTSGAQLLFRFLRYKLSPNLSLYIDVLSGENAIGQEKTAVESVIDRFKPMFLSSVYEIMQSDTDGKFGFIMASLFGAGLNTYSQEADWNESKSKEIQEFKEKVGEAKFKKANTDFNRVYNWWIKDVSEKEDYKDMTNEQRESLKIKAKEQIKDMIFKANDFKYKAPKKSQKEKDVEKNLLPRK